MTDFREAELEALRILWEAEEPLKPADIQSGFSWEIDNGTLRSTLAVLVEKGHVTRKKKGKAFFYRPKSSREKMMSQVAGRLARFFTGGSAASFITQLIQTEKLSKEEIEELRRIAEVKIEESKTGSKAKPKGGCKS